MGGFLNTREAYPDPSHGARIRITLDAGPATPLVCASRKLRPASILCRRRRRPRDRRPCFRVNLSLLHLAERTGSSKEAAAHGTR
jgi:hypothetical protein